MKSKQINNCSNNQSQYFAP